ncbi:lytic polysaccharide monooxygenase [Luteimicrobium subarcticum]|uniref:lytic polysaccharide monooxygenase n=1 Tax=Luteimicrobium subarcticum TaxID=620910 RepID=UPI002482011A|nr:lytic polysaccharide monooxygenase [Luteimicrobium subarcticum]
MRTAVAGVAALATALTVGVLVAPSASAHGWITSPPSRQDFCSTGKTSFDCGEIKYEPQSVEAPHGSLKCSGGSAFTILDDSSKPWPRTNTGTTVTFQWKLTAAHATSSWEYFVDGKLFTTFAGNNKQPPFSFSHTVSGLPTGQHTILARWNISDTANSFYSCVDLNISSGGTDPGTPTATPTPTVTPTVTPTKTTTPTKTATPTPTTPGTCSAAAWSSSLAYVGGNTVTYNGSLYQARWWTQGETPSNTAWGPWKLLGTC